MAKREVCSVCDRRPVSARMKGAQAAGLCESCFRAGEGRVAPKAGLAPLLLGRRSDLGELCESLEKLGNEVVGLSDDVDQLLTQRTRLRAGAKKLVDLLGDGEGA